MVSEGVVQLRQAPHSTTFCLLVLRNRYQRNSLSIDTSDRSRSFGCRLSLWVTPEYNGTLDNVMYTDVKASDGGPRDLLTSSLTEEQSMLGPSVANILHATLACSARRRMVRRLVNDELKDLRVNCMWCLGSIAEWLRRAAKDVSQCSWPYPDHSLNPRRAWHEPVGGVVGVCLRTVTDIHNSE